MLYGCLSERVVNLLLDSEADWKQRAEAAETFENRFKESKQQLMDTFTLDDIENLAQDLLI